MFVFSFLSFLDCCLQLETRPLCWFESETWISVLFEDLHQTLAGAGGSTKLAGEHSRSFRRDRKPKELPLVNADAANAPPLAWPNQNQTPWLPEALPPDVLERLGVIHADIRTALAQMRTMCDDVLDLRRVGCIARSLPYLRV